MHKNEPIKFYGFIIGYYHSQMCTLRNGKDHVISSRLGTDLELKQTSLEVNMIKECGVDLSSIVFLFAVHKPVNKIVLQLDKNDHAGGPERALKLCLVYS